MNNLIELIKEIEMRQKDLLEAHKQKERAQAALIKAVGKLQTTEDLPSPRKEHKLFFNPSRFQQVKQMLATGMTVYEISKQLGCHESTIRYHMRRGKI